jgi:dihydroxyacetone kinase-like predicted kinase
LARAADQAYAAVARPVEGTMLSVARAAADGAQGRTLRDVVSGAVESARTALARTSEQLEVLRRAGVVDAGGRGLLVVLESLSATVHGRHEGTAGSSSARRAAAGTTRSWGAASSGDRLCDVPPLSGPSYEVMYLLDAPDDVVPALRAALDALGDTVVVVGGGGLWNVHVHTDDVAAAISRGRAAGRVRRLRVTSFARQRYERERAGGALPADGALTSVVPVVVDVPPQVASLVADHGARLLLQPSGGGVAGQERELDDLVRTMGDAHVVLVPASQPGLSVAEAVTSAAGREAGAVPVLPTRSFVQALAAVSVHDASLDVDQAVARMAKAASEVRWGAVAWGGPSGGDGDAVGSVGDAQVHQAAQPATVARAVVQRLLADGAELLTVLPSGTADAYQPVLDALLHEVERHRPEVEVTVLPPALEAAPGLQLGVE